MRGTAAQSDLILRIDSSDLSRTSPKRRDDDQFVAQLGPGGLGCPSYVVGRHGSRAPEWIVLGYAADRHERVWRRARPDTDGVVMYVLVEDDSSTGYVGSAERSPSVGG